MSTRETRREFLARTAAGAGLALMATGTARAATESGARRLNVLLITADDLNWNATNVTGCKLPGITPNIDRLASEGLRFERAHVATSLCQPSRTTMMTGRYCHRTGTLGFKPIRQDVPTLGESLRKAGYLQGILGKVNHITPEDRFCWDVKVDAKDLFGGRNPDLYYSRVTEILKRAGEESKPFFIMANVHDPHRPFPPRDRSEDKPVDRMTWFGLDRLFEQNEVEIPGFLPDIPEVREEVSRYYSIVPRCDKSVGKILQALEDAGHREDTLVMFLSDNGMPVPFAKCSCYPNGTRTPWIVRWPGKVKAGQVDKQHFISTIDFTPTVLEALGLPSIPDMDGRSFLPLLEGKEQADRDCVFTTFDQVNDDINNGPIRSVTAGQYQYIYNAFHGREEPFGNGRSEGPVLGAMQEAAKTNPAIAKRVDMLLYRVPDELYDVEKDVNALNNLVADPAYQKTLKELRERLLGMMTATNDPWLDKYKAFLAEKA